MLERRLEFPHANGRYSVDAMSSHLLNKFINLQVKTPTLFLLGAQDLRVPVSNGLQVSPCASVLMYGWVKGLFHISSFSNYLSVGFLLLFFEHRGIRNWLGYRIPITVDNLGIFFSRVASFISFCYMASYFFLRICFVLCLYLVAIFTVCKGFEGEGNRIQNYCLPRRYPWNWQVSYFLVLVFIPWLPHRCLTNYNIWGLTKSLPSWCRPQSDFESFLNIGVWFKKHMSK